MLDERVRAVMTRLEEQDRREREQGVPRHLRARQGAPTTGRFLFGLVAHHPGCEVLELGGSRGYSALWLAAGVRYLGGRLLSFEIDAGRAAAWRDNIADAGLDETAELIEGNALELLPPVDD